MKLVFLETPSFTRHLRDYLTDDSYRELQHKLMDNPEMGVVIPGTGGFRKVRWEETLDLTVEEKKVLKKTIHAEIEARRRD